MTKKKANSAGVHVLVGEIDKIKNWLDQELLMQARSVKIIVSNTTGIGENVTAIALDERGEEITRLDATDYRSW